MHRPSGSTIGSDDRVLFTEYARSYDRVVGQTTYYQKLLRDAHQFLGDCSTVLDVGCATGNLAVALGASGSRVVAIDNNEEMVKRAKQKVADHGLTSKVDVLCCSPEDLDYSSSFDGVALLNVLHVFDDPYAVLDSAYRALRKDGIVVCSGPKPNANNELLLEEMVERNAEVSLSREEAEVYQRIGKQVKNTFSTERIEEVLSDFVGFSDVVATDRNQGYQTYLGQGYFLVARKGIAYEDLTPEQVSIRFAREDERETLYRIRYHFTGERWGVWQPTPEQEGSLMESDEYDPHSFHFVAEHGDKILSIMRLTRDTEQLRLPVDETYSVDYVRQGGNTIWEPGRWIKMPFAPRGTGRRLVRTYFEIAKREGVTHLVTLSNPNNAVNRKLGWKMETETPTGAGGYHSKAIVDVFSIEDPPHGLTGEITDSSLITFLASLDN